MNTEGLYARRSMCSFLWRLQSGLLLASLLLVTPSAAASPAGLVAVVDLRVGVERLAKLHLEQRVVPDAQRAKRELAREQDRMRAAITTLIAENGLDAAQRRRVSSLSEQVESLSERSQAAAADANEIYRDSDALTARIGFVSAAIGGTGDDNGVAALADLIARGASTALRVGRINFAAASGVATGTTDVDVRQAMVEFNTALRAIAVQDLSPGMKGELELAENQWLLLRNALGESGLTRDKQRLSTLATTSDRIAESLLALAKRAARAGSQGNIGQAPVKPGKG